MKTRTIFPILLTLATAGAATNAALAHGGVQNPAVLARMDAMKAIGDATKVLGEMAKGATAFDAATAQAAAAEIAAHAAETPALFEAPETDAKSEALPGIWEDFADFTAKASALEARADTLASGLETPDDLNAGLGQLGEACTACHKAYRE